MFLGLGIKYKSTLTIIPFVLVSHFDPWRKVTSVCKGHLSPQHQFCHTFQLCESSAQKILKIYPFWRLIFSTRRKIKGVTRLGEQSFWNYFASGMTIWAATMGTHQEGPTYLQRFLRTFAHYDPSIDHFSELDKRQTYFQMPETENIRLFRCPSEAKWP